MGGLFAASTAVLALGVGFVQGGGLGGGGFGGGGGQQGGAQGPQGQRMDRTSEIIDREIEQYLDGEEVKSILTPGEFTEWNLTLNEGQVVIAEARSEAFDPALQVVDEKAKVLAENDDRYPGDQRPLLLWRCPKDGEYKLRGRCFQNKAGGQMFLRMKTYDSVDAGGKDVKLEKLERILVRIPLKAGQIRFVTNERPNDGFAHAQFLSAISPLGLPDIEIGKALDPLADHVVMAPVDGDYYVLVHPIARVGMNLRVGFRELEAKPLARESGSGSGRGEAGKAALWSMTVKEGEVLQAATAELGLGSDLIVTEAPDLTKYDLKKAEKNPFFPKPRDKEPEKGPALTELPARARDPRISVFVARRDATLWIATDGKSDTNQPYQLTVQPAAKEFAPSTPHSGRLRIGNTDYWSFEAKVGDVMRFQSSAGGFAERTVLRDPDLAVRWDSVAAVDKEQTNWELIVQKPGRYLVSVSCLGDGGAGEYTLSREVYVPKEIRKGSPAAGELDAGQVHVWKLDVSPTEPLLVRWKSGDWTYSISVRDETGAQIPFPMTQVDGTNRYGILKADRAKTLTIVLIPTGKKTPYSIEVNDLPGFKGGSP